MEWGHRALVPPKAAIDGRSQGRWSAMATDTREQAPRDKAVQQLKKRRDFYGHLLLYALVNAFLVVIWALGSLAKRGVE